MTCLQLRPQVAGRGPAAAGRAPWGCSASPPTASSGCSPVSTAPRRSAWPGWRRCSAESCGTCWWRSAPSRSPPPTSPGSGPSSLRPCASTYRWPRPTGRSGCPRRSRRPWRSRCPSSPTTAYGWTGRCGTPRDDGAADVPLARAAGGAKHPRPDRRAGAGGRAGSADRGAARPSWPAARRCSSSSTRCPSSPLAASTSCCPVRWWTTGRPPPSRRSGSRRPRGPGPPTGSTSRSA